MYIYLNYLLSVGQENHAKLKGSIKINTDLLTSSVSVVHLISSVLTLMPERQQELECVAKMVIQSDIIEKQKPKVSSNDFHTVTLKKEGQAEIANSRFKTRVRRSDNVFPFVSLIRLVLDVSL